MSQQPFRGTDKIVIERRLSNGALDLRGEPQPPVRVCPRCGCGELDITFDQLYAMFFAETDAISAFWEELEAWLKVKGWSIRAKTW